MNRVGYFRCRECGVKFASRGIKNHEVMCMPVYTPRTDKGEISMPPVGDVVVSTSPLTEQEPLEPSARFEFPKMLYNMLEECTFDEDYSKIISWQPHGLAFKVHNRDELERILPQWFREKYESFLSLLEQWGFWKLTRGKDRGCWYHKKFYHSRYKKNYDHIEKEDFLDGMPAYLSFRDEPDLEKEATLKNRIPPIEKKTKITNKSLGQGVKKVPFLNQNKALGMGDEKAKVTHPSYQRRYSLSTLKQCRYCHELFTPQGLTKHEEYCRVARNVTNPNESDSDDDYDDDDNSGSDGDDPSNTPKFRQRKKHESRSVFSRQTLSDSDDDDNDDNDNDDDDGVEANINDFRKCRHCNNYFSKYGVKKHEAACMRINDDGEDDSDDSSENKVAYANPNRVPCRFCGLIFSRVGVQLHERACKEARNVKSNCTPESNNRKRSRRNRSRNDHKRTVLSDDSSVDSIKSGCKICGFDDDHANLLLCEGCDVEVHTYCLNPPLQKVPANDWFCDACNMRAKKTKEELSELVRRAPAEMYERFGEICFAKSAENAHWWPALIFDPRSFLHNQEVVDLARRYLGSKRYLVFFFENQDAFAAIPNSWIMTWDEGIAKGYDTGRSVRNASKSRKQQFEKAMELADEAFEDIYGSESVSDGTGSESQMDSSDIEDRSSSSRIPRVIGGDRNYTVFDYSPGFKWRSIRDSVVKELEATDPSEYPVEIDPEIERRIKRAGPGRYQATAYYGKKCLYICTVTDRRKAAFVIKLFLNRMDEAKKLFESGDITLGSDSVLSGDAANRKRTAPNVAPDNVVSSSKLERPFGTFIDKRPRRRHRSDRSGYRSTPTNAEIDQSSLQRKPPPSLPPPKETEKNIVVPPKKTERKTDSRKDETDLEAQATKLPPLSDQELNELLLSTPFCQYYLLPLSQL